MGSHSAKTGKLGEEAAGETRQSGPYSLASPTDSAVSRPRELGVELQGGALVLCPRAAQLFEGDLVTFP